MPRHVALSPVLFAVMVGALTLNAAATEPVSPPPAIAELQVNSPVERDIGGAKTDVFTLELAAGQVANVVVEQKGIDVVLRVASADGKTLTETDDESRPQGSERTIVVADAPTTYRIGIQAKYPRASAGRYVVTVTGTGTATDKDRWRFEAATLSLKAISPGRGKVEEARDAAARAVALGEKALPPHDRELGTLYMRLGYQEKDLAHYDAARKAFERAAQIYEAAQGREDALTARALEFIGMVAVSQGDFAKAEALYAESQGIVERTLGADHPRMINCLLHLSVLHQELEDPRSAIADLERARPIGEKWLDPDDFQITAVINNIGTFYRELGDYDRAEPLLEQSLHRIEKKFGLEHPYIATPLQELGIIARERKDFDGALALLWRAEAAREKAYGFRNPQTAATLMVIANVYDEAGQFANAVDLRRFALETVERTAGPYQNNTMSALASMATSYMALKDVACATEYQARLDRALEKNMELNLAIGSERQKLTYAESASQRTDRTIWLHVAEAADSEAAAEQALLVLLQRKERVLDAMSQNLERVRAGLEPDDRKLLDRLRVTTAELASVALSGPGKTALADYRAKLQKLDSEKGDLEAQISKRSAAFRAEHRAVTIEAVRAALPPDAALIEISMFRPYNPTASNEADEFGEARYVAYVLRQRGRVTWRDLGKSASIDAAVSRWREALRDPERNDVDRLGRAVDEMVMQPLRALLGPTKHLLVSPDGQLGLVPFEAFVDRRGRYLVERYAVTYLTSGRDVLRMRIPRQSKTAPVVIADPLFGEPSAPQVALVRPAMPVLAQRRSVTSAEDFSTVYFAPLAGTREEARSIGALFPEAKILTGKGASKAALQHLDAPEILHVATHGFFLQSARHDAMSRGASGTRAVSARVAVENPLLRSGLALSGANLSASGRNDGVLTAMEAANLNLWGTKLVTLSACDSGVGEVKSREGVYGLRRSFFLAGAETLVMSLWPVSDYVTRQMMTTYYAGLKHGLGRGAALRRTQLSMLQQKARRHPFYWASFIQSGDWTPLGRAR